MSHTGTRVKISNSNDLSRMIADGAGIDPFRFGGAHDARVLTLLLTGGTVQHSAWTFASLVGTFVGAHANVRLSSLVNISHFVRGGILRRKRRNGAKLMKHATHCARSIVRFIRAGCDRSCHIGVANARYKDRSAGSDRLSLLQVEGMEVGAQ
jgi:hypothetical protein